MQNPPLPPAPHPGLPLPSSGDTGSAASSACCSLRREAWVSPEETPATEAASHPSALPRSKVLLCTWVLSEHPLPPAPSQSVPAVPGTGTAAPSAPATAAEPPPRSPPKLSPASNESPAHGWASPQHVIIFIGLVLAAKQSSLRASLFAGTTTNPAPSHVPATGMAGLGTYSSPPISALEWTRHPKTLPWVRGGPAAP